MPHIHSLRHGCPICSAAPSGQAPKPHRGAPKARGLTAKARTELPSCAARQTLANNRPPFPHTPTLPAGRSGTLIMLHGRADACRPDPPAAVPPCVGTARLPSHRRRRAHRAPARPPPLPASPTHIAALVGRSLDRTNDRLLRLFHAGYIDRPRAQLDYYPTAGSSPIAYALADRGARLLIQRDGVEFANVEWSRKNRKAGRPFIEHQLEIVDFSVALQLATGARRDVQFIHPNDIIAAFPEQTRAARNPLSLRVKLSHQGAVHEIGLVPDLVFGLQFADGSRHSFMVEIDRGTMPIARSDFLQTSFERKMRAYLTAHAGKQHEKHFGWKTFRVLTVIRRN